MRFYTALFDSELLLKDDWGGLGEQVLCEQERRLSLLAKNGADTLDVLFDDTSAEREYEVKALAKAENTPGNVRHTSKNEAVANVGVDPADAIRLFRVDDDVMRGHIAELDFTDDPWDHRGVTSHTFVVDEDVLLETLPAASDHLAGVWINTHRNCAGLVEREVVEQ